ncbi:hypothetical protein ZWY2020_045410 [Hordeum vulgare]|nr:hypothetical protein ZWY2020_045410 [Hordeum vulgare]
MSTVRRGSSQEPVAAPEMEPRKVVAKSGSRATREQSGAATPKARRQGDLASRGSSGSPVEWKTPDPAASLSARLGGMVLMDKKQEGLVFETADQVRARKVHVDGTCDSPIDSKLQWGGWLRASSRKQASAKDGSMGGGGGNVSLGSSRTGDSGGSRKDHAKAKDNPIKRNLQAEFSQSASFRTGVERRDDKVPTVYSHPSAGRDGLPGIETCGRS